MKFQSLLQPDRIMIKSDHLVVVRCGEGRRISYDDIDDMRKEMVEGKGWCIRISMRRSRMGESIIVTPGEIYADKILSSYFNYISNKHSALFRVFNIRVNACS